MSADRGAILLTEDDPGQRQALARALRAAGFTVAEADGSQQAIAALASSKFDVLLTDINMPGISGLELLGYVRDQALSLAVVLMTGLPTVDTAIGALRDGAVDYLTKPIKPDLLFARLDEAIKKQRLREALLETRERAAALARAMQELDLAVALAGPLGARAPSAEEVATWPKPGVSAEAPSPQPELDLGGLSPREREITLRLGAGRAVGEVAAELGLSTHTVRNHVKSVFNKLRVHSQLELVSKLAGLHKR